MGIASAIVIYIVLWWIILFTILPLWVQKSQSTITGNEPGAPHDPQIKKKIIITSLAALAAWLAVYAVIDADIKWLNDLFMNTSL